MTSNEAALRALMMAGLDGDAAAHRTLLDRLSRHLRAYYKGRLARIGRSASEAEDLVQEALIAVHIQRHTYDPAELLTPWVHAIARYKLIDHLRRRGPCLQTYQSTMPMKSWRTTITSPRRARTTFKGS